MFELFLTLFLLNVSGNVWASTELKLRDVQPQLVLASAATSSASNELSVNDLGFSQTDLQSDLSQKELDTREDMLKIHQMLGIATEAVMLSEFVVGLSTSANVGNGGTDTSLVSALGWTTLGLYLATASFEMFAPKPKNKKRTGNTAIHEALSWIHLPLMIIVPLTGDMLSDRIANNQTVGNLAVVHGVMATTLLLTYTASLTIITF